MTSNITDFQVRLAAFKFLDEQTAMHGEILPRMILEKGFIFDDQRVPLISPQGIFTPRILDLPLTFCTVPPTINKQRPYDDDLGEGGLIRYRYRGIDPEHRDNEGLRTAMKQQVPLIYLFGIVPGKYRPVWPAFVVGDDVRALTFSVSVDDKNAIQSEQIMVREDGSEAKRRYITIETRQRLHQAGFRERILHVYHERCAVCRLHHRELLEAAHILPDNHPKGDPIIPNGISLCKLHHAAFDESIMGIRPDYVIEIREDILSEHDGPMLKHGLQELQGRPIDTPRLSDFKPSREFLEIRYDQFRNVG